MNTSTLLVFGLLLAFAQTTYSGTFAGSSNKILAISADKQLQQSQFRQTLKNIVQHVYWKDAFATSKNEKLDLLRSDLEDCLQRTLAQLTSVPAYTQHYETFLKFEVSRSFELAYVHFLQACKHYAQGKYRDGDRSIDIVAAEVMSLGDTVFGCLGPSNQVFNIVSNGVACLKLALQSRIEEFQDSNELDA